MIERTWIYVALLSCLMVQTPQARADEPETPQQWIDWFAKNWDSEAWVPQGRGRFNQYMRDSENDHWQHRMLAMHHLVAAGEKSVQPLAKALASDHEPTRILAAQTLGYLAPHVPVEALQDALQNDSSAAVRLYAVDSLGMQGGLDLQVLLEQHRTKERNGDVRKHIGYALERAQSPVAKEVVKQLADWDPKSIHTAKLGSEAPDFELKTVSGSKIKLSDYRGKKNVVLVFIYGDT